MIKDEQAIEDLSFKHRNVSLKCDFLFLNLQKMYIIYLIVIFVHLKGERILGITLISLVGLAFIIPIFTAGYNDKPRTR